MQHIFIEYVYLILIILALVMLANRLRIAYPIVLLLGGLALSFTSFFSNITIDPHWVFFIFLPPLLYEAAWQVSWKEFWRWRRVITSFAFPIVIITSCVIAFASSAIIPGFSLAHGFLLGGIISPPDAISATTIMRNVHVPKRLIAIIEGESLLNDASSLIVFRFALAAIITGQFHFSDAASDFLIIIFMGILTGLIIALIFYAIHRWLPTTSSIEIVLTLVTPYCMYYFAEKFHFSGVLAVVSGGLFLSNKRLSILNYESRIQGVNVWTNIVFVLNGIIFLLIGLQLPNIVHQLGDISLSKAIQYGLLISLILILTRMACTLIASPFTTLMSYFIKVADPHPHWKIPVIFGWAGMRGVVSLAAALSIPIFINDNKLFPYRDLILFITFIVIVVTLVLQGLTLPWLIKKIKPEDKAPLTDHDQEMIIQKEIARKSLEFLEGKYGENITNDHAANLHNRLKLELRFFNDNPDNINPAHADELNDYFGIYLEMLEHQRSLINQLNHQKEFDEELIRKYHALIDLEELKVREKLSHK